MAREQADCGTVLMGDQKEKSHCSEEAAAEVASCQSGLFLAIAAHPDQKPQDDVADQRVTRQRHNLWNANWTHERSLRLSV
jgi:hypothetical protein